MPFELVARAITRHTDHRLDPVPGDDIDELVNQQLQRGRTDRR